MAWEPKLALEVLVSSRGDVGGPAMALLHAIEVKRYAHNCPACSTPTKCAIDAGKSASTCWCMSIASVKQDVEYGTCLCKTCLTARRL